VSSPSSNHETAAKRRRLAVASLGALALFNVLFWLFAVRPLSEQETLQQARLQQLELQVRQKTESLDRLRAASEKLDGAVDGGDDLLERLTFERRTTFSELLKELNSAADEAGVELRETSYNSGEIDGNASYGMVSIAANFRGRYPNLVKLLNRLDRSEKFLIVERLGAAPREDGGLQIAIRIDAFVRGLVQP